MENFQSQQMKALTIFMLCLGKHKLRSSSDAGWKWKKVRLISKWAAKWSEPACLMFLLLSVTQARPGAQQPDKWFSTPLSS